jgi:hypothetical protein
MRSSPRTRAAVAAALLALAGLGVAGCGPAGPKTYPVRGRVEFTGGDVGQLAGSNVEAALENEPTVRASGVIEPDGAFTLATLDAGVLRKGAKEGKYRARIILAEEDATGKRRRPPPLAPRFLQFATSGLALQVPTSGEVTLKVSSR